MRATNLLALCGAFAGAVLLLSQAAQGQQAKPPVAFSRCATCHATIVGRPSPVGPNLFGVEGRVSGSLPGFHYSDAMKKAAIHWDAATLDAYIASPVMAVPGTTMVDTPEPDPGKRKQIVDYLLSLK